MGIRQQELQLEHRHAQLKDELNVRLSLNSSYSKNKQIAFDCNKFFFLKKMVIYYLTGLDKTSEDVAAEGAILNEMLDIVAQRAALRPSDASSQECTSADGLNSDVSYSIIPATYTFSSWAHVLFRITITYACILYYAFTRHK